jgi:hypothetical protein
MEEMEKGMNKMKEFRKFYAERTKPLLKNI